MWTSGAHDADVILTFVRTDPDAPKHKGISVLLIPTDSPGLTRRPFGSIIEPDDLDFNEVFFDDVEVPAENLVGPLHDGWRVATGSLGHERAMLWLSFAERLDDLVDVRRPTRSTPTAATTTRSPSTGSASSSSTPRRSGCSATARWPRPGRASRPRSSRSSSCSAPRPCSAAPSTSSRRSAPTASTRTKRIAVRSTPSTPSDYDASWFDLYLRSFAGTIAGGTSQIQRNIVAERVLGLPR